MDQMQNTKHRTWGLVVCSAIIATSAWAEKVDVDKSKLRPSDLKQIDLFEKSLADNLNEKPNALALPQTELVPTGYRVQHHVVTLGSQQPVMTTKDLTQLNTLNSHAGAIAGEKVVYSNSLYDFGKPSELTFIRPGIGVLISDDIGTELVDACGLRRIRFVVNGGVVGGGGTFSIIFSLVDGCPDNGGVSVPGTFKFLFGLDNNKGIIHVIDLVFPDKTCGGTIFNGTPCTVASVDCQAGVTCDDIPGIIIPPDFYMSLQFNTNEAGWLGGNPPERGFSDDSFYRGGLGCAVNLGDFPFFPHGSNYAVVSAKDTCETHYLAYQATSDIAEAVEIGQGNRWAEDLTLALGDEACEISTLEIGFRATGNQPYTVDVDIREFGGMQGLADTAMQFIGEGGDKLEIARFRYPPGVFLPSDTWVTFSPDRDGVGVVMVGETQAGSSKGSFRLIAPNQPPALPGFTWTAPFCIANGVKTLLCPQLVDSIFYVRVKCRGDAPLGACCPSLKVPTVCEGGPTPGKSCESDQECAGGQCMLVDRPCNDGQFDCPLGSQCLNTCSGGIHDGLTCYTDDDCVSVSAPSNVGTCVGAKKCDKATCFDGVSVLGCPNGRWQVLNATGTNSCADNPFDPPCGSHACCLPDDNVRDTSFEQCLRIKDPFSPSADCGRCMIDGAKCFSDSDCTSAGDSCVPHDEECATGQLCQDNGICAPRTAIWHPGNFAGQDDFSCPTYACSFGANHCFEEQPEIICLNDTTEVFVCPNGAPCGNDVSFGTCILAGCDNPACCNLVCQQDSFCCDVLWDFECVRIAEDLCPFVRPDNDECVCKTCDGGTKPCYSNSDCGFNLDGSPSFCTADSGECSAEELLFTEAGSVTACAQNSTRCRAYGEVNTARATNAPSDPTFCCSKSGTTFGDGTVWYRFTMPDVSGATSARFNTCNTADTNATDSIIQVYKATDNTNLETACSSLVTIGCNDDAGGTCGQLSDMCVDGLVPGETYYITLASPVTGVGGRYLLEVEVPCSLANPPTSNDDCNDNDVIDVCDIVNGEPDVNGDGVPDACECAQPQPESWTSIGQHGQNCVFNPGCGGIEHGLDIPADGGFSEPRSTGINKIVIAYDSPVDVSNATVLVSGCDVHGNPQSLLGISMSVVAGANSNEAVLMFSPSLPGNNPQLGETPVKYDITISGVDCIFGTATIIDETRTAWAIFGDANSVPIIVNNGDLGYVRTARDRILSRPPTCQAIGCEPPASLYEIRSDINNDNTVSNGDLNLVRLIRDGIAQPSGKCP